MPEPWLRIPVVCPQCGAEELFNMPVAALASALLRGNAIELHTICHDLRWNADATESQQLRECLASVTAISEPRVCRPEKARDVLPVETLTVELEAARRESLHTASAASAANRSERWARQSPGEDALPLYLHHRITELAGYRADRRSVLKGGLIQPLTEQVRMVDGESVRYRRATSRLGANATGDRRGIVVRKETREALYENLADSAAARFYDASSR